MAGIVATEEILDVVGTCGAHRPRLPATVSIIARELAISESTARKHLRLLVIRGWVEKGIPHPGFRGTNWVATDRGHEAYINAEGF